MILKQKTHFFLHYPSFHTPRQTTMNNIRSINKQIFPVDTGCTLNVHKTFRRCPERLLNVLCKFNLRPVSTGLSHGKDQLVQTFLYGNPNCNLTVSRLMLNKTIGYLMSTEQFYAFYSTTKSLNHV